MESEKSSNNYIIYLSLAGIVLMAAAFVLLNFFVFSDKNTESIDSADGSEAAVFKKFQIKNLDIGIFQDHRYLKLKDSKTSLPDISQLNPGKADPFKAD